MKDKVVMVTGATDGIGKATALRLAQMGFTIVVVGRNLLKSQGGVEQIRRQTGNPNVDYMVADLSVQHDIHELAAGYRRRYSRLDVLVNNAGAIFLSRQESIESIEMTLALNHLAYFLLTNLLLNTIKMSAPARIVNVSALAHKYAKLDIGGLQGDRRYNGWLAYCKSKLANLLFTFELTRRLEGTCVTVNALHPGIVRTGLGLNNGPVMRVLSRMSDLFSISPEQGSMTSIYLATSAEVEGVTGEYFSNSRIATPSKQARDEVLAWQLWDISEELTSLRGSSC